MGHHRLASETPFKWCFAGEPLMPNIKFWLESFVIFQGIRTSFAKNPYILLFFRSPDPLSPSGSAHAACLIRSFKCLLSLKFLADVFLSLFSRSTLSRNMLRNTIGVSNSLDPDQVRRFVGSDLGTLPHCLPVSW